MLDPKKDESTRAIDERITAAMREIVFSPNSQLAPILKEWMVVCKFLHDCFSHQNKTDIEIPPTSQKEKQDKLKTWDYWLWTDIGPYYIQGASGDEKKRLIKNQLDAFVEKGPSPSSIPESLQAMLSSSQTDQSNLFLRQSFLSILFDAYQSREMRLDYAQYLLKEMKESENVVLDRTNLTLKINGETCKDFPSYMKKDEGVCDLLKAYEIKLKDTLESYSHCLVRAVRNNDVATLSFLVELARAKGISVKEMLEYDTPQHSSVPAFWAFVHAARTGSIAALNYLVELAKAEHVSVAYMMRGIDFISFRDAARYGEKDTLVFLVELAKTEGVKVADMLWQPGEEMSLLPTPPPFDAIRCVARGDNATSLLFLFNTFAEPGNHKKKISKNSLKSKILFFVAPIDQEIFEDETKIPEELVKAFDRCQELYKPGSLDSKELNDAMMELSTLLPTHIQRVRNQQAPPLSREQQLYIINLVDRLSKFERDQEAPSSREAVLAWLKDSIPRGSLLKKPSDGAIKKFTNEFKRLFPEATPVPGSSSTSTRRTSNP